MELDEEIQDHLHLSADFLRSARRDVAEGLYAPARFAMLHALELALKAALMAKTRREWDTHNIHGPFGQHFRASLDPSIIPRLNRLIQEYGKSRYPDWEAPAPKAIETDLEFVASFIEDIIPRLISEVV